MSKNIIWWIVEWIVWYLFFFVIIFTIKNPVNEAWVALILTFLASFGIFSSPLTRHLSIWNKVLDKIIRKEEEREKY